MIQRVLCHVPRCSMQRRCVPDEVLPTIVLLIYFVLEAVSPHWQAWQRICEASRQEFNAIYERLGVRVTERGESFYNPALGPLVEELLAAGVAEESNGAIVSACFR